MNSVNSAPADDAGAIAGDRWLDDYLPYLIYRVSALMNARLQGRLASSGLSLSQWRVLSVLRSFGNQSITGIVDHSLMEQPTVSRVVAAMQRDGYVRKLPSPLDSRVMEVSLTDKGLETFRQIGPAAVRHQREALAGLTAREVAELRTALVRVEATIIENR